MQNIITFVAPYSLVVSLLYLFGFWGVFNINVLEYIALTDVIKNALYPLLYSSVFIVLGFAISNLVTVPLSKRFPSGGGKDLPEAKFIRWLIVISVLYLSGLALYTIFFQVGNARWLEVALIVSPIVSIMVVISDFASGYIKNRHLRTFISLSLSSTLLCSYGWGATNAERAKKSDQIIEINGKASNQKYLGWAGDFLFLWDDTKSTIVVKAKNTIQTMELRGPEKAAIIDFFDAVEKQ